MVSDSVQTTHCATTAGRRQFPDVPGAVTEIGSARVTRGSGRRPRATRGMGRDNDAVRDTTQSRAVLASPITELCVSNTIWVSNAVLNGIMHLSSLCFNMRCSGITLSREGPAPPTISTMIKAIERHLESRWGTEELFLIKLHDARSTSSRSLRSN